MSLWDTHYCRDCIYSEYHPEKGVDGMYYCECHTYAPDKWHEPDDGIQCDNYVEK